MQAWLRLVPKLPSLKHICISASDHEMRFPGIRRDDRHGLAEALNQAGFLAGLGIDKADVLLDQLPPANQLVALPNLIYPLSLDEPDGTAILPDNPWPRLQRLKVQLALSTPSGAWYMMPKKNNRYASLPHDPILRDNYPPPLSSDPDAYDSRDDRKENLARGLTASGHIPLGDKMLARNVPCEETVEPLLES
ncbi:hypothetical protein CDD83_1701 [Cordyceps sp. RAO-2017]|nr:hypothetical protein CDD83_1701 [Cordyceps sp. RAO-2017]